MLKVSIIMRKLYSVLVSCIRLKSKTLELKIKVIVICMIYFANMCYLYLVAGVYKETDDPQKFTRLVKKDSLETHDFFGAYDYVSRLEQGIYTDHNLAWYTNIGYYIIMTMWNFVIFPPIEVGVTHIVPYLKRAYDQKKCCCPTLKPTQTR